MGETAWKHAVARYQRASTKRALWQLTHTFGPYVLTLVTLTASLRSLKFRFWDEQGRKLVGYAHLPRARR